VQRLNKKVKISLAIMILLLSGGIYYDFIHSKGDGVNDATSNDTSKLNNDSQWQLPFKSNVDNDVHQSEDKYSEYSEYNNKYYSVYIRQNNGTGSSFFPQTLNPGINKDPSGYHVSLSFDDNGNIIKGEKVIVIDNFVISKDNEKMIKKIAGKNYKAALQEIKEQLIDTKENIGKDGL